MAQQMERVFHIEGLRFGMDAALEAAIQFALLRRVGIDDAPVSCLDDVEGVFESAGEPQHVLVHARLDPVVRFDDGDVGALRFGKAAIACGAVSLVLLVEDADAPVLCCMSAHDFEGPVGGAVVEADNLEVAVSLRLDAVKALIEIALGIVCWNDHADQETALGHVRFSLQFHHSDTDMSACLVIRYTAARTVSVI